jgi:hypothetical protein
MGEQRVDGSWRVVQSTDPSIRRATTARLAITDDGLRLWIEGAGSYEIAWSVGTVATASNGQTVLGTGHGTVWLEPQAGADPTALAAAVASRRDAAPSTPAHPEFPAGDGQLLVLYRGADDGSEVDPAHLLAVIADDASRRSADGWHLVSMVGLPLRHAGQKLFGVDGSGYTTKAAIGCLYARPGAAAAESTR